MAKPWVLDTETKGTGAQMVPLETIEERNKKRAEAPARPPKRAAPKPKAASPKPAKARPTVERTSSPLGPGQVRKKATGEIGKVLAVDPKAGTATVRWLKQGRTSTVPLTAVSRR